GPTSAASVPSTITSSRTRLTDPKAAYVFTSRNGSKDAFIAWFGLRRFRTGNQLSSTTRIVTRMTGTTNHAGPGPNALGMNGTSVLTTGSANAAVMATMVT